jgi:cytochrome c biogenesis protein CcmG/thiol:disulfide interchange protein DsbE
MKLKLLIPLLAFGLLAVLLARGLQLNPREIPSPLIGKPAPTFELAPLHEGGRPLRHADLLGRVSVINVWASWCAPCRQEHPLLVDFAKRQPGIQLLGLNYKDDRAQARQWLKELGDPYAAIGFDAKGQVGIDFGVYGVPETFVVDRQGQVRYKHVGPLTPEVLRDRLEPLLKVL